MTYNRKQQCYACDQLNYITLNCEILTALIDTEKVHQVSYEDWFIDSEDDLRQIKILISSENLWMNKIKSFLQKMKNVQWFINNNNFSQ